jgi:DNA polymerase-1
MLMSYVLDAGRNGHGMDELSRESISATSRSVRRVPARARPCIGFDRVAIDKATAYAAEDADVTLRLWQVLKPRLAGRGDDDRLRDAGAAAADVLARMERRGIAIDRQILSRLSGDFAQGMARLEAEIHELAGESFNLGSPKQLGDILFGKMGLPAARRPTGAWSTGADVLEDLAEQGHDAARKHLDWRQLPS